MTDLHALSGAYAVDALDEQERLAFEEHLLTCGDCLVEVSELQAAAEALSIISATEPGDHVRDAVLSGIQKVRPLPPLPAAEETGQESIDSTGLQTSTGPAVLDPAVVAGNPVAPGGATVVPWRRRRVRMSLAAAAAVLAVVGVGGAITQPWANDPAPQPTAIERILDASDLTSTRAELPGGARAEVMRSNREDAAMIKVTGMNPAPAGKVYQVWWQSADGSLSSAGLMNGTEKDPMMLQGPATSMTGVGITIEPDGGSEQPTSTPLAMMALTQT